MSKIRNTHLIWTACAALMVFSLTGRAVHAQPEMHTQTEQPAIVSTLIASANFWRSQKNVAYARRELDRALLLVPSNADVLADAAEMALDSGDSTAADAYRQRLTLVAPNDVRTKALAAEHALTPSEAGVLEQARRLGQAGDAAGALQKYASLLNDGIPPANLEVEYYTQLGATQDGFEQAVDKLGTLADQSPANVQLQLAFARLETLQEEARSDGLRRLMQLTSAPEVRDVAQQSWREAMLWQGASEKARSQLEVYLERYPGDAALEAKKKEFDAILPDASTKAMIRGYNLMASDVHAAEQAFREALAANPNNPDAMSMLAAILRISKRPAEAQVLLNRAVTIAPDRKTELYTNAGGNFAGQMAISTDELVQVASMTAVGHYAEAEQLLVSLVMGHATAPLLVQLADLQRRAGHLDGAVESLRSAHKLAPTNADADCALAEALMSGNHYDDASASLDEAQKLYAKTKSAVGTRRVSVDRAALLRAQQVQASSTALGSIAVASR